MDGFGLGPKYPGNAVENTPKPHLENIFKEINSQSKEVY